MGNVHVADFPLSKLLAEYAWSQRPPLTIGQLAIKAGVSRASMYAWVGHGVTPQPETLYHVGSRLGIPLVELYEAAGLPVPQAPLPRRVTGTGSSRMLVDPAVLWEEMIAEVVEAMRAAGQQEPAIQQVVAHIRARQFPGRPGLATMEGHVVAEFAGESSGESGGESGAGARGQGGGREKRQGTRA